MNIRHARLAALAIGLAVLLPVGALAQTANTGRTFDLQGHRGARGLAPENTLAGFARALEVGVTTLELDCGVTKDGVVVVSHDRLLNPDHTRDATGKFLESERFADCCSLTTTLPEFGSSIAFTDCSLRMRLPFSVPRLRSMRRNSP